VPRICTQKRQEQGWKISLGLETGSYAIASCTACVPETKWAGPTRSSVFSSFPHLNRSWEGFPVGHIRPHVNGVVSASAAGRSSASFKRAPART